MRLAQHRFKIATKGQGLYEITEAVTRWVAGTGLGTGLLTLYLPHTSASLLIQENAAPEVRADLADFFATLAPEATGRYRHEEEGPDDMPAHLRAALLPTQLAIPLEAGRLALGTWQGVFVVEHRRAPHERTVVLHLQGE